MRTKGRMRLEGRRWPLSVRFGRQFVGGLRSMTARNAATITPADVTQHSTCGSPQALRRGFSRHRWSFAPRPPAHGKGGGGAYSPTPILWRRRAKNKNQLVSGCEAVGTGNQRALEVATMRFSE